MPDEHLFVRRGQEASIGTDEHAGTGAVPIILNDTAIDDNVHLPVLGALGDGTAGPITQRLREAYGLLTGKIRPAN